MLKKIIITMLSCVSVIICSAMTTNAADETVETKDNKIFLYPIFTSLSIKQEIPHDIEVAVPNVQFELKNDNNSLSVNFKFKSEADKKNIILVSVYDVDESRYITSDKGIAITDTCTFTGLIPGHKYMLRASSLFEETNIDVVVTQTKAEAPVKNNIEFNVKNNIIFNFDDMVSKLKQYQIINGYEDGSVRPDNNITRAEVCAIINRVIRQGKNSMSITNLGTAFTDVLQEEWFYDDVVKLSDFGFVNGYENNTFKPQNNITYNEYIKIITSLIQYLPYAEENGGYPNGYIIAANDAGIIHDMEFDGNDNITRKDAITILYNAINSPFLLVKNYSVNGTNEYVVSDITYMDFIN